MSRSRQPEPPGDDLLTLLDEQEHGPLPCPHGSAAGTNKSGGWTPDMDPNSVYYLEYVHVGCGRSSHPGTNKIPAPTMGWSRQLQKDVPL